MKLFRRRVFQILDLCRVTLQMQSRVLKAPDKTIGIPEFQVFISAPSLIVFKKNNELYFDQQYKQNVNVLIVFSLFKSPMRYCEFVFKVMVNNEHNRN